MPTAANKSHSMKSLADAGLVYAAVVWGITFSITRNALNDINPLAMVAYRFLIAGLLLLVYLLIKRKKLLENLKHAAFLSVILWMLHGPQTIGLGITTASNSGFITGLFVVFIPIFMFILFRKRPSIYEVAASLVSLAGLWVLTGGMSDVNLGDIITIAAAMAYALHVLFSDKYMKAGIDPIAFSCQQFLFVGLISLVAALVLRYPLGIETARAGWTIVFLAVFPTISAFVVQMYAQRITAPIKVSLIFATQPVFAAVFAWTYGGESVILHRALGGGLIFLALVIAGLSKAIAGKPVQSK